jgi:hypothetical protein
VFFLPLVILLEILKSLENDSALWYICQSMSRIKVKRLHLPLSTFFLPTQTQEHVSEENEIWEMWGLECVFWLEIEFVLEHAGWGSCMSSGHL